ncbi:MAG: crotonase [Firmicutes bacterium HGW-Firmicutes-12]|nr:MAG: crotonase [Firmicutes bacterium HGW-Firmicutes-12]
MDLLNLKLDKNEGIATIIIDRQGKLNSLNKDTVYEFKGVLEELENDEDIRVIIITGAGDKSFCVGTDIDWLNEWSMQDELAYNGQNLISKIETMPQPVIAAINGYALGGDCELILACDIRICSNKAKLGLPEVDLGVIPGYGGTQRLSRIIGIGKAKELILTGDTIDAKEAEKIGLVNRIVDHDNLMAEAIVLANKIKKKGPIAVRLAKAAINLSSSIDLSSGMIVEKMVQAALINTQDKKEGIAAFKEKRKPNFTGR